MRNIKILVNFLIWDSYCVFIGRTQRVTLIVHQNTNLSPNTQATQIADNPTRHI